MEALMAHAPYEIGYKHRPIVITNPPTIETISALIRLKADQIAINFASKDERDARCAGMIVKVETIEPGIVPQNEASAHHPFYLACTTLQGIQGICMVDLKTNTATWKYLQDLPKRTFGSALQ